MPPPQDTSTAWIELPDQRTFMLTGDCQIGRVEGNEIINPDTRISRRHAVVQRAGDYFVLVDLGSTNGTFLNEGRIHKPTRLKDGDVITVGVERYTFCQPRESEDTTPAESMLGRTIVMVGKVSCFMLMAAGPEIAGPPGLAWLEQVRLALVAAGAQVRPGVGASLFAHWRDRPATRAQVRGLLLELAAQDRPPRALLALHHGAVRVGRTAEAAEENLLGAEVTFTHKLATAAAKLEGGVLLSEAAVQGLDLAAQVRPLGAQAVSDLPGTYPLFAL